MFKNHKKKIILSAGALLLGAFSLLSDPLCSYYFPDQPRNITCKTISATLVSYIKSIFKGDNNDSE